MIMELIKLFIFQSRLSFTFDGLKTQLSVCVSLLWAKLWCDMFPWHQRGWRNWASAGISAVRVEYAELIPRIKTVGATQYFEFKSLLLFPISASKREIYSVFLCLKKAAVHQSQFPLDMTVFQRHPQDPVLSTKWYKQCGTYNASCGPFLLLCNFMTHL